MPAWQRGREVVDRLVDGRELEIVQSNQEHARFLLGQAVRHLASGRTIMDADPVTGFSAVYEAARKAFTAVLAVQGLRPTSRGGHLAVQEAIMAQFGGAVGPVVKPFDWMRRTRNENEYPSAGSLEASVADVEEALGYAEAMVDLATRLVATLEPYR